MSLWSLPLDPYHGEMAYVVSVLRSLGYRASLHVPAPNAYFAGIQDSRSRAQAGQWFFIADYPAPSDFLQALRCAAFTPSSPANPNVSEICDRKLDRLIAQAARVQQSDPEAAAAKWALADRRAVDIGAVAPMVVPRSLDLLSRRTGNYQFSPVWGVLIDQLWVR